MIDPFAFVAVSLALLATPGPTNTLLAASGAAIGFSRSLKLLAGELSGYLASITILIVSIGPVLAQAPGINTALRAACGAYLLYAACKLWNRTEAALQAGGAVSVRQVFVATLLNPKALVFAFAIIPTGASGDIAAAAPWMAALSLLIAGAGACWIGIGRFLRARMSVNPRRCCQAGAVALAVFAVAMSGMAFMAPPHH